MKNWKLIICLVGIFLAGAVTGGLLTLRFNEGRHHRSPERWGAEQMKNLADRLELTPAQVGQVSVIINRAMEEMHTLRRRSIQQATERMAKMEAELKPLFTPKQRAEYERIQQEQHERFRKWMSEHARHGEPPPPPPPGPPPGEPPPDEPPPKP